MSGAPNTRIACNLCRRRKIRCDKAKPACETCQFAGVPCVFTPLPQKKSVPVQLEETKAYARQLENDLQREKENRPLVAPSGPALHDPSSLESSLEAFRWHLQYCTQGIIPDSRITAAINFETFAHQLALSQPPTTTQKKEDLAVPKWPSPLIVERSINHYVQNRLHSIFPFVDPEALVSILNASVFGQAEGPTEYANQACLVAFTAFITRIHHHEPDLAHAEPDSYAQAAFSLVPQLVAEHSNVRALESLTILAMYIAPLGQPQTAELLLSMALRILYNLGGHTNQSLSQASTTGQIRDHEHLRQIFWLLYSMGMEMTFRKCQPTLINDADCDLSLPTSYVPISSNHQFFTTDLSNEELLFPTDLRLALIKSKIHQFLYSQRSLTQPVAVRLQLIRELDYELSELKSRFPAACQPDMFITGNVPDAIILDLSLRGVNIHLEYYHCLAKIHGAILIGSTSSSIDPHSSSLELCYQAARSTLLYINRVRNLIKPKTFWIYAQFILTAVLALYSRLATIPAKLDQSGDFSLLEKTRESFAQLNHGNAGRFPPFVITEAFIRHLMIIIKR